MIQKLKGIAKTDLVKTSFFTSIAVFVRIVTAFVLNKIVAIYVGPVGVAMVGQFNNFFGIVTTIGTGGIGPGVIKYISENRENTTATGRIISTSLWLMVIFSLTTSAVLFLFPGYFSGLIFKSEGYQYLMYVVAATLVFASLNTMLMSVLNGHKEVKKYTAANIATSLCVLVLSVVLGYRFKITGVLVALALGQSVVFFVTLLFVLNCQWFKISFFVSRISTRVLQKMSRFSLMSMVSAFTTPVSLMVIRNYIGNHLSWQQAGYWQGVWTISEVYLMFITSSLSVYYLPRLTELKTKSEIGAEIKHSAKIILPLILLMALLIFLLKQFLVKLLFTGEFEPMLPLFKYQLIGDLVKIACWLIAFQMLSKAMTLLYVLVEIITSGSFIILTIICVRHWGLEGAPVAFCLNYSAYFVFLLFYFRRQFYPQT